jgi:hypothetical protein
MEVEAVPWVFFPQRLERLSGYMQLTFRRVPAPDDFHALSGQLLKPSGSAKSSPRRVNVQ